jgi:hypothetical protein
MNGASAWYDFHVMATRIARALTVAACLLGHAAVASAQRVEVAPFAGYRFGGGFFELVTGQPVDLDGAPSLGVALDVPLPNGFQVEGLFTHQHAHVLVPAQGFRLGETWPISVDHWQAGALQEFSGGRLRPFLTGTLGLTRFAAAGDSEIRFTVGAGGGLKVFPTRHVGVRLDGRVFATFVDADARLGACTTTGRCLLFFHADMIWQADFTAGVVFRFDSVSRRSNK